MCVTGVTERRGSAMEWSPGQKQEVLRCGANRKWKVGREGGVWVFRITFREAGRYVYSA